MRALAAAMRILGVLVVLAGIALGLSGTVGLAGEVVLYVAGLGILAGGVVLAARAAGAERARAAPDPDTPD